MNVINLALAILAAVLAAPAVVIGVECLLALLPRPGQRGGEGRAPARPRIAVLVPAHDEEAVIEPTIRAIREQLRDGDRVLVVADNCGDGTAAAAERAGAEVVVRRDAERRGKGYALAHGVRALAAAPPDVLVVVDADCTVEQGALESLARTVARSARPAQAVYLMETPANPTSRDAVSAFAFLVKNLVRPTGLRRLGAPCLLTGTGMALPWAAACSIDFAGGNIVEDMQIGLDLALAGTPPILCEEARVTGRLPQGAAAATGQRTRWEHGHLRTILTQAPRVFGAGLRRADPALLALGVELSTPPLSLVALAMAAGLAAMGVLAALGLASGPFWTIAWSFALLAVALLAAWARFARGRIPLGALVAAPVYAIRKIPLYIGFAVRPQTSWVRTERDHAPASPPPGAKPRQPQEARP